EAGRDGGCIVIRARGSGDSAGSEGRPAAATGMSWETMRQKEKPVAPAGRKPHLFAHPLPGPCPAGAASTASPGAMRGVGQGRFLRAWTLPPNEKARANPGLSQREKCRSVLVDQALVHHG